MCISSTPGSDRWPKSVNLVIIFFFRFIVLIFLTFEIQNIQIVCMFSMCSSVVLTFEFVSNTNIDRARAEIVYIHVHIHVVRPGSMLKNFSVFISKLKMCRNHIKITGFLNTSILSKLNQIKLFVILSWAHNFFYNLL